MYAMHQEKVVRMTPFFLYESNGYVFIVLQAIRRVRRPHSAVVNSASLVLDVLFYNLCCVTTNRTKVITVCPEFDFIIVFADLYWIISSYKSCCFGFDPVNQFTESDIRCIVKQNMDVICFPIHFSDDDIFRFHGFSDRCRNLRRKMKRSDNSFGAIW